jgi:hypothetical protein
MTWVRFPWSDIKKGQGFFVPCLDLKQMRMLGMRAALPYKFDVDAIPGVYKGQLGLLFVRTS